MATPTTDTLRAYYPHKDIAADGNPVTTYVADAGCTTTALVDAALIEGDDYWNGGVGVFLGDVTAALEGHFFHVKDFVSGTDTIEPAKPFPAAPAAGDSYRLFLGGGFRSSHEIFGMLAGGVSPEFGAVVGTNVTGLTIKKLSRRLGAGTLSLFYDQSENLLFAKMDAEAFGVGLDVSGDVTDGHVFAADGQSWVRVDVTSVSLPVGDETDTFTIAKPSGTVIPDYEGYETDSALAGKTRYRLVVVKNEDGGGGVMVGAGVGVAKPAGSASALAAGESLTTAAGSFDVDDATGWPTRGFWLKNTTVNGGSGDCRYINYRSGVTLAAFAVNWATLGFDAGLPAEIVQGDLIEDMTSGATAEVDQVTLASGTWAGSNAAGTLLLKDVSGTFGNDNGIKFQGGAQVATANGASALGLRGYTATAWSAADAVELMPDVDIGLGTATVNEFETPASETIQPDGVTFSVDGIDLGHMEDGDIQGIWFREWILSGHQARANVDADLTFSWS